MSFRSDSIRDLPVLAVALAIGVLAQSAKAEIVSVDSHSASPVYSQPLTTGVTYIAEATGAFWLNATLDSDSGFAFANIPPYPGSYGPYEEMRLYVDNQKVDWLGSADGVDFATHTYSSDHRYRYSIEGHGQPVSFLIWDNYYSDNSGSVQVALTAVPEPASLALVGLGAVVLLMGRRARA